MRHHRVSRRAAAIALALAAGAAQAEAPFSFAATPGKLPKDVIPLLYDAHLVPDFGTDSFKGSQTVEIEVLRPTARIVLNAANLAIERAAIEGQGLARRTLQPLVDEASQTVSFQLAAPLAPGRYALALGFRGQINREGRGLFGVSYMAGGADRKLVATLLAPADARRLLPTWDEPAFRARFRLTVDLPPSFQAYSNTPVEKRETLADGRQRISFAPTPNMPSYLMALVAGELERAQARRGGVEIGVVTTEGKLGSTAFPLAATGDLLRYYNNYFGIPYPLPKLDQIAIPGGFYGAMESWGGIVYNEALLLVDPKKSPEGTKKLSFGANAHELAHQWFGNLVTMAWWDNLWLNEGFASWMAAKATEHFHPEWRPYLDEIAQREKVLDLDARKSTHPIQTPIENEEQAANAFDAITYIKSKAFLRMLEAYVGEDHFRKGLRAYMAAHKYSNTTSSDLWAALEKASGKPVGKVASDWTLQPGYPLISVSQVCENGRRKVTVSQEQFRLDEPAPEQRLWRVPLQVGTVDGRAWTTLLSSRSSTLTQGSCEGTLVVDPHSVGYYRIQYDRASFDALARDLARLPDTTRLKFLADTWSLVAAGRIPLGDYLRLLPALGNEPRVAVWAAALARLETLDQLAQGEPEQALVRQFTRAFVQPTFARLGWRDKPGEAVEQRQLRALLAGALVRSGDEAAVEEARTRFARYLEDPASTSPEMLDFVLGGAGMHADATTVAALAKALAEAGNDEERNRLARALAAVKDPALAAGVLRIALSPQLPPTIAYLMINGVARVHPDQVWAFAVANREALLGNADAVERNRMFADIVGGSVEVRHADMMEHYVAKNFGQDAQVEARRVGDGIRIRAAQKARLLPQVRAALAPQQSPETITRKP